MGKCVRMGKIDLTRQGEFVNLGDILSKGITRTKGPVLAGGGTVGWGCFTGIHEKQGKCPLWIAEEVRNCGISVRPARESTCQGDK